MNGRLMVDPSFLLAEDGLVWLEEEADGVQIVVPATIVAWLRGEFDLDPAVVLASEDVDGFLDRRERALALVERVDAFGQRQSPPLSPPPLEEVRRTLLAGESSVRELRAEEWVFLQTNSVIVSKLRHPVESFRDAGAVILEYGRKAGHRLLTQVIPEDHLPAHVTGGLLAKAAGKWILVGGAQAGGGTLGGLLGTAVGGPVGTWAGHAAGVYAGKRLSTAAFLLIDP
jgi:hypothetical protein